MTPERLYICIVPSELVLDQPGSWRIRKWGTEPFPEANYVAQSSGTQVEETAEEYMRRCVREDTVPLANVVARKRAQEQVTPSASERSGLASLALDRMARAHKLIHDICQGHRRWTMSVPVQQDDPDMVLTDALNTAEQAIKFLMMRETPSSGGSAEAVRVRIIEAALRSFPEGQDITGQYTEWKFQLDKALEPFTVSASVQVSKGKP